MTSKIINPLVRRRFLERIGGGVTSLGAVLAGGVSSASAQSAPSERFQAARHVEDDWMDRPASKHRTVFDTTTAEGVSSAALYAGNLYLANRTGYNLQDGDLSVIIVVRHMSTPFAFKDAIWAKYGGPISGQINFTDPKTKQAPATNVYGSTLEGLLQRGAQLAVCQMATQRVAGAIARATGADSNAIYDEIAANLLSNSHLVPAGIVAVNRAQERGYTFAHGV
jgi:intracellular sulfur oxidation DsrE/DsrF family protein